MSVSTVQNIAMKISTIPKRKKINRAKRARLISRAITLTWASLDSHLSYLTTKDGNFDKDCTAAYAEVIHILTQLY